MDKKFRIFGVVGILIVVVSMFNLVAGVVNCASPSVYTNAVELKECLITNPEMLNGDLITQHLDVYSEVLGGKYNFDSVGNVKGVKYSLTGLKHEKSGEVLFNGFPEKTKFSLNENNVLVDVPANSELDLTSIGNGNIELKGDFKIRDPKSNTGFIRVKSDGGLFSKNGDLTLLSNSKVDLIDKGVQIVNGNNELLHLSPFGKSSFENAVSFNKNVLDAVSSTKGQYQLLFEDGKDFVLKNGISAKFGGFDFGERVLRNGMSGGDVKEVQKALEYLGYDVGGKGIDGNLGEDTESALRRFQRDYLGLGEDSDFLVDGVVGSKTKEALTKLVGNYPKVSTIGDLTAANKDGFNTYATDGGGELIGNGNYVLDSPGKTLIVEKDSGDITLFKNSRKVSVDRDKMKTSFDSRSTEFDGSINKIIQTNKDFSKADVKEALSAGVYAESDFNAKQITVDANSANGGYNQIALNPKQFEQLKGQKVEYLYYDSDYGKYKSKQIKVDELLDNKEFMKKTQEQYNYFKKTFNNGKDYDALNPDENNKVMVNYVSYVLNKRNLPVTQENVLKVFNFHQTGEFEPNSQVSSTYYNALAYLENN